MGKLFKLCVYNVLNFLAWAVIVGFYNLFQILGTVQSWFKRK
jgi:hypothetical protein